VVTLAGVPGVTPPDVEGVPGVVWVVMLPGVPGVTPPDIMGAPGTLEVPELPGVPEVIGPFGGLTTKGAVGSITTSSGQGADGSVPSVAPVQCRPIRAASTPAVCANTWPQASSKPVATAQLQRTFLIGKRSFRSMHRF
jgi:hypothetical protein